MFFLLNKTARTMSMLGITLALCACVTTGETTNNGLSDKNVSQAKNQSSGVEPLPNPEPGLPPRQRILKAIQQLEVGKAEVARAELNEYLISTPDSSRAKHLLKQITTPANEFYPAEFFTVELAFGQSISTLSQHYLGSALEFYALAKYNGIENPSRINTGSKIKIPLTPIAKSVREKDEKLALSKAQADNKVPSESLDSKTSVTTTENQTANVDEAEENLIEVLPETPETLRAKLAEANNAGDFAQSILLLESLKSLDVKFDENTRLLAVKALVGRADSLTVKEPSAASLMYAQAGDLMQQNNNQVSTFDYYKLAYETDNTNAVAQQKMTQLQQQIVDKYHREASIAFRQQRIEEAIEKWDIVLHVDPSNSNVSAYRTQALELQQRLKVITH